MAIQEIGEIKLARGQVGYYDPLTKIHLMIARPTAKVYSNYNTEGLKRAVKGRVIELIWGTLATDMFREESFGKKAPKVEEMKVEITPETKAKVKKAEAKVKEVVEKQEAAETNIVEPITEAEVEAEVKPEENNEEQAEVKTTAKKTSKKNSKKKVEE